MKLSRFLPLVVGSAGVFASMSPAKALNVNVNGTNYDVTTVATTYDASSAQLQATPWWGNQSLAESLAQAVYGQLGQSGSGNILMSQWGSTITPIFVYSVFYDNNQLLRYRSAVSINSPTNTSQYQNLTSCYQ